MAQAGSLDLIQEQRPLTEDEQLQKALTGYEEVARNEEIGWRQRFKVQWIKSGDKNTKYFYRVATTHKSFNTIDSLQIDGVNTTEPLTIKNSTFPE